MDKIKKKKLKKEKEMDKIEQLEKKISQGQIKSEKELKIQYGQPDKVEFLKTRNRNYIYTSEKLKIKCERKFEINSKDVIVGFSSKNCF